MRANGRLGRHEQLGRRFRCDDRADIASIEHRAALLAGEGALKIQQRGANPRMDRHPAGRLTCLTRPQRWVSQLVRGQKQRNRGRGFLIIEVFASFLRYNADTAVEQARIQDRKFELSAKARGDRALAGGGRAVNGDNKPPSSVRVHPSISPPRARISGRKPGKLVAIMPGASIATGRSQAKPKIRWLMAMRWSPWVFTRAPPMTP